MNRTLATLATVALLAGSSVTDAEEVSRQKFLDFFTPIVGEWQITNPDGETSDFNLAICKSKMCFIADSAKATHIYGWNPKDKCISVMSFFPNGNQGVVDFVFESEKTLVGDVTIRNADGSIEEFKLTWRVVSNERQEYELEDQKWVVTRRK